MTPAERLSLHLPRCCEAVECERVVTPVLGELHQSGAPLKAAIYECQCGNWRRAEKLKEATC